VDSGRQCTSTQPINAVNETRNEAQFVERILHPHNQLAQRKITHATLVPWLRLHVVVHLRREHSDQAEVVRELDIQCMTKALPDLQSWILA
jgi:hypothetical protein